MRSRDFTLWGSELSPFTLKVLALNAYAGLGTRLLPAEGGTFENSRVAAKVAAVRRGWRRVTYPPPDELAEFPLVPYLLGPAGEALFDSSAIAEWLDRNRGLNHPKLLPPSGAPRFAARIIDEFCDEIGLYCAHHNRWVISAATNDAGSRLANEFRTLVPQPLRHRFAERFAARQVRRLPYLFSVAPAEPDRYDVPPHRRPPGRVGFPPTHELLESIFRRVLDRLEAVFRVQPFLLGERFSVADASVYGALGMNMSDPSIAAAIEIAAPATAAWLTSIKAMRIPASTRSFEIRPCLVPLLDEIGATLIPLLQQNAAAYTRLREQGLSRFNEAAFDLGESLYDGVLGGHAFRSVVKTFQVKVWRELKHEWALLAEQERASLPFVCA